jgi:ABC-type transporter Mla subunit MlaD
VIRDELRRLRQVEERHRRLLARLVIAGAMSALVFVLGTVLIWVVESGRRGGDINGLGDSAFFTAVQLLSVSSSIRNPLTALGKIIDIGLEVWAVFVVTAVAGSFASFFSSAEGQ